MLHVLAQQTETAQAAATNAATSAATEAATQAAQTLPVDVRTNTVWLVAALIAFAVILAIWAMTKARTPLAGDHH